MICDVTFSCPPAREKTRKSCRISASHDLESSHLRPEQCVNGTKALAQPLHLGIVYLNLSHVL
jgi:hypothetical protein